MTAIDPENARLDAEDGFALIENRELLQAEKVFSRLLEANPDDVRAARGMIIAKRRQGYFAEVIERCDKLLSRQPDDALALGERIVALVRAGQVDRALEQRGNLNRVHNPAEAKMWLVSALLTKGQPDEALELARTGLSQGWEERLFELQSLAAIAETESWDGLESQVASLPGVASDPVWARYEFARRHRIEDPSLFDAEPKRSLSIEPAHYCPLGSGTSTVVEGHAPEDFAVPSLSRDRLQSGLTGFLDCLRRLEARGVFDDFRESVRRMRERFATRPVKPVQILSTGRCGTFALHQFLLRSSGIVSYHTCHWQLLSVDRNHIQYRILENRFDDDDAVELIVRRYLQMRVAELAYAARLDCSPVIINHWDTLMAPVNAVVYDDMRFVHMHRHPEKVFESVLTKNQWQNEQMRHSLYDPAFPRGRYVCSHNDGRRIEEQIAWYIHATFEFARALGDALPSGKVVELPSEDLFARTPGAKAALREVMAIEDLADEDFDATFSKKINDKSDRRQKASEAILGKSLEEFRSSLESLRACGQLQ